MQSFIGLWSMASAKRKCWKFKLCITESKKPMNITQKSVPTTITTNERTIISETKYFLVSAQIPDLYKIQQQMYQTTVHCVE